MTEAVTSQSGEAGEELLTTPSAALAAGITFRRLDYLVRRGLLHPRHAGRGSGRARLWPAGEVEAARIAGCLAGLSLEDACCIARAALEESRIQVAPRIWLELGPPLSDPCDQGDCEECPDGPGDCGCGHHADETEALPCQ